MTDLFFYHLEQQKLEQVLPILLAKTRERDWRAAVQCVADENKKALTQHLWTFASDSFLPHATDDDPDPEKQPILISAQPDNLNMADVRFYVGGARPSADATTYQRLIYLFDGHDLSALENARADWKSLKGTFQSTYWQQNEAGRWQKKA